MEELEQPGRTGMVKMAKRLWRWEQRRFQKKTEEAKKRGGVSASLFLEGEMNVLSHADCFFFYGSRRHPKGLLTIFFPDEEHAEITVAQYEPGNEVLPALFAGALRECKRVNVRQVHTVRNPSCGFDLGRIEGVGFTYAWSEYMLCSRMEALAAIDAVCVEGQITVTKEPAPEEDGTICYRLLWNGQEAAECRVLPTKDGTQCYLFGLKTKEAWRRNGLATRLLVEIAREYAGKEGAVLRLQVSSKNDPAERLYRKLGFVTEEQREYYTTV